ncbi:1-(5-phosphoribosyl)-5-[(5-phosphoribosylamino)methylideneamino]imidazole-4-carboxamide isomerase [candidate division KSB1 bacterium]
MIIIPAVDISSGRCVRLKKGKKEDIVKYGDNPVEIALKWEEKGGRILHLIDLDRAIDNSLENVYVIIDIIKALKIPVELGGGMRKMSDIEWAISGGAARVIIGTSVLENRKFVEDAVKEFGSKKIVVGIDASNGYTAIRGWKEITEKKALELAVEMQEIGIQRIIYTDIEKDGMLVGANIEETRKMIRATNLKVIASGGISSLDDIRNLKVLNEPRLEGVIVGKAIYEKRFSLEEAISVANLWEYQL